MEQMQKKGIMLCVLGLIITILCIKADEIGLGNSPGHGIQQWVGTFIGAVIILFSTHLMNIKGKTLLIIGIIIAFPALLADQIGIGGGSGFGLKQSTVCFIGIVCGLIGAINIKIGGGNR